jgi:transposase-like protein
MTSKQVRGKYTHEFKLEAVRQVKAGQSLTVTAKVLGIPKASLGTWVRESAKGLLSTVTDNRSVVTPEQMELARIWMRLHAFGWSVTSQKKPRRTSRRTCCEVRLDSSNEKTVSCKHRV